MVKPARPLNARACNPLANKTKPGAQQFSSSKKTTGGKGKKKQKSPSPDSIDDIVLSSDPDNDSDTIPLAKRVRKTAETSASATEPTTQWVPPPPFSLDDDDEYTQGHEMGMSMTIPTDELPLSTSPALPDELPSNQAALQFDQDPTPKASPEKSNGKTKNSKFTDHSEPRRSTRLPKAQLPSRYGAISYTK